MAESLPGSVGEPVGAMAGGAPDSGNTGQGGGVAVERAQRRGRDLRLAVGVALVEPRREHRAGAAGYDIEQAGQLPLCHVGVPGGEQSRVGAGGARSRRFQPH